MHSRLFALFTPRGCEHFFLGDPNTLIWHVGASYSPPLLVKNLSEFKVKDATLC
jgi:hypothetical protein